MEKLHAAGIHVAIDTCGYVDTPEGLQVLKNADLLLFDIKGMDPARHLENTGVSNELIWRNLRMLGDMGKDIIIRMPIIPGYTDDDGEIRQAGGGAVQDPLHPAGGYPARTSVRRVKYDQIGMEYTVDPTLTIPEERQQAIKALFEGYGFKTQIGG